MNYASDEQLMAVGQACSFFVNRDSSSNEFNENDYDISCEACRHWIEERCKINVFDDVLTSIDQT